MPWHAGSVEDEMARFVRARQDDDEAVAKEAARALARSEWESDGHHVLAPARPMFPQLPLTGEIGSEMSAHIALHDPARVLREVEAKRKRLGLYLEAKETLAAALKKAPPEDDPATAHSYARERINANQASGRFTALEMSVRLDAVVWGDHPDYRQEWRP